MVRRTWPITAQLIGTNHRVETGFWDCSSKSFSTWDDVWPSNEIEYSVGDSASRLCCRSERSIGGRNETVGLKKSVGVSGKSGSRK